VTANAEQPRRLVIVLGRRATLDVEALARCAATEKVPLLFLCLGYPVERSQAELVEAAVTQSVALGVFFEAVLVFERGDVLDRLEPGDDLTVLAEEGERRRVEARLLRRGRRSTLVFPPRDHVDVHGGRSPDQSVYERAADELSPARSE
jgi:hypothetical protein